MRLVALFGTVLVVLSLSAWWFTRDESGGEAGLSLADAMRSDTTGYARVDGPRDLVFPDDYGPHPDYRTEWWYLTGNLEDEEGNPYGYEVTFFRIASAPPNAADSLLDDGWTTRQMYLGHFGITDGATNTFRPFERFSRGSASAAGAQASPFRVFIDDWVLEETDEGMPVMRLKVEEDGYGIDLVMRPSKPMVLHGDRGYSRKGEEPGNASMYYSWTRLETTGTLRTPQGERAVTGLTWKDREWSTNALGASQTGWDWFALQLSDGRDLMFYQLRERDGSISPMNKGLLVERDGSHRVVRADEVELEVTRRWTSPHTGAIYPAGWRLRFPNAGLDLTITPLMDDQEMTVSVTYWEGAVRVSGAGGITGRGYVEMTGYTDERPSRNNARAQTR